MSTTKQEEDLPTSSSSSSSSPGLLLLHHRVGASVATMATQQFLNTVLSQRGPSALPYSDDVKWLIRHHLLSLTQDFPSLHPEASTFTHNDGRSVNLLRADGTIPMSFNGVTYNLPVLIWLMESYPRDAPRVFLNPTRDMVIKRPHPLVNPSGLVSIPFLHDWVYPNSNLVDLARSISLLFGQDPPLFSRHHRPPANPNKSSFSSDLYSSLSSNSTNSSDYGHPIHQKTYPNSSVNPSSSFASDLYSNPSSISTNSSDYGHANHLKTYHNSPEIPNSSFSSDFFSNQCSVSRKSSDYAQKAYPPPPVRTEDPEEVYRKNVIGKLVETLHGDIGELRRGKEGEIEGVFELQGCLRERGEELRRGVMEMKDVKEGLEQELQMILMNSDILEGWVRENEAKVVEIRDFSTVFEPFDMISKQLLDSTSSDLAIEDVIYALDKAVQEGSMPFGQYLKNVRLLSREQFFHRAMSSKIRSVAVHARISRMAARASHVS